MNPAYIESRIQRTKVLLTILCHSASARNNLVGSLAVQHRLPYYFSLLKIFKHALDGWLVLDTKVADDLLVGFDAVGRLPEIGNEIQNVNFFHVR